MKSSSPLLRRVNVTLAPQTLAKLKAVQSRLERQQRRHLSYSEVVSQLIRAKTEGLR